MFKLDKCCWSVSLQKGTAIIAMIYIVQNLLFIIFAGMILGDYGGFVDHIKRQEAGKSQFISTRLLNDIYKSHPRSKILSENKLAFVIIFGVLLVLCFTHIICSVLLIIKIASKNKIYANNPIKLYVKIWLILAVLKLLFILLGTHIIDIFGFLFLIPFFYWWICVYAYQQQLKNRPEEPNFLKPFAWLKLLVQ